MEATISEPTDRTVTLTMTEREASVLKHYIASSSSGATAGGDVTDAISTALSRVV